MNKLIRISVLFMLPFLLSACLSQKSVSTKELDKSLDGLWLYKGLSINNSEFKKVSSTVYKAILNGKYISFRPGSRAARITGQGEIEILSDSVLIEKVRTSINSTLNNKVNRMTFEVKNNRFLTVTYLLEKMSNDRIVKTWYSEIWEKQGVPIETRLFANKDN